MYERLSARVLRRVMPLQVPSSMMRAFAHAAAGCNPVCRMPLHEAMVVAFEGAQSFRLSSGPRRLQFAPTQAHAILLFALTCTAA